MSEKKIKTKTVSRGVAKTSPIELDKTKNTAIYFKPTIHDGGVNGELIKFKKPSSKAWSDIKEPDFTSRTLGSMEKIAVRLNTASTEKLLESISNLGSIVTQGIQDGRQAYVVAKENNVLVIDDKNKLSILKQILDQGLSDQYWKLIAKNQPDLAYHLAAGHIQKIRADTIAELKQRLTEVYSETSGPDSWQKWIFKHNWLFGVNYQKPIEKQKINLPGSMPDYLFPRIDGFVDLLEIKLPSDNVLIADSSHEGSYRWNSETAEAIGQVATYLAEIERQQLEIERNILKKHNRSVSLLKPRAYILIGNSKDWPQEKLEGLRKLNNYLHGIEVLTYQDLIYRGEAFLDSSQLELNSNLDEDHTPF